MTSVLEVTLLICSRKTNFVDDEGVIFSQLIKNFILVQYSPMTSESANVCNLYFLEIQFGFEINS